MKGLLISACTRKAVGIVARPACLTRFKLAKHLETRSRTTQRVGMGDACVSRAQAEAQEESPLAPCITLTNNALAHLTQLKEQKASTSEGLGNDAELLLRIGIKQGGCSGMSYFMDFETPDKVVDDDAVMVLEGDMKLVCDPKSLLYLFGMELDYSNELIGGGFKFSNPNADSTCGCGKSFSV